MCAISARCLAALMTLAKGHAPFKLTTHKRLINTDLLQERESELAVSQEWTAHTLEAWSTAFSRSQVWAGQGGCQSSTAGALASLG